MRQLRLFWLSSYSASQRRVSSLPDDADGVGLPGVMASSECDRDSEGPLKMLRVKTCPICLVHQTKKGLQLHIQFWV